MACSFMMEYIRANLFLPGQVENWNILIDLDNLGLTSVPYKVIILCDFTLLEFKKFHGNFAESVQVHIFSHFYHECIILLQHGMVDSEGFLGGAYEEEDLAD